MIAVSTNGNQLSYNYHRILNPLQYMDIDLAPIDQAHTFVFSRQAGHNVQQMKNQGKRIIMDIDDYWHLYPEHYLFNRWRPQIYIENLKLANVVTTTNAVLAAKIKEINKNVVVIPNALPFDQGQFTDRGNTIPGTFGYVGGNSHSTDIKMCPGAKIPPHIAVEYYMNHYEHLALSFAPLVNNEFNQCKSNIKALESGVNYAALMASEIHPYLNELDKDVVIYCRDSEWANKTKYCQQNPNYVKDMGQKLGEHVRKHYNLIEINKLRKQVWEG